MFFFSLSRTFICAVLKSMNLTPVSPVNFSFAVHGKSHECSLRERRGIPVQIYLNTTLMVEHNLFLRIRNTLVVQ